MKKLRSRTLTSLLLLAAASGAAVPQAGAAPQRPISYTGGPSFQILNNSGLTSADAKFYYLGFGQIGSNFVFLMPDGSWQSANAPVTVTTANGPVTAGWNPDGWNQAPPAPQPPAASGAGVVPCYPVSAGSTVRIPANLSGARLYFFQVNAKSPLFNTPCATAPSTTKTKGIFGSTLTASGGQAPFAYFSTANGGALTTPIPAWLANGSMPLWSYGEIGSGNGAGTIDTSQVDFIGFPMNVTAQMTALDTTYPVWNQGVGFSFSPNSQVNMKAVLASYSKFVQALPTKTTNGQYTTMVRSNFAKLKKKIGKKIGKKTVVYDTVLFNPGNYIPYIEPTAFQHFFLNLINNYMWVPYSPSFDDLPAVTGWSGKIDTGGQIPPGTGLPRVTFNGQTVTLPGPGNPGAYPGYTGTRPLQAIQFTSPATGAVAYVLSPVSYQVLCKAKVVSAGCGTPAFQIFAAAGALAAPGDNNQYALLTPAQQEVWDSYGGAGAYNLVVARLGLIISAAFNRGVAGGLTTPGGLCAGKATLNDCWNDQSQWYPTPKTASERRKFFNGDTTQNHFSRWLHTAQIQGIPMMTQPVNPATLTSGVKMGMGYGFSNDENPTPQPATAAQTPSKYDGIVALSPPPGCNYITIMPWQGGKPNPTPVTSQACNPNEIAE